MALPKNYKKKSTEEFKNFSFMASNYCSNHLYILKVLKNVLLMRYDIQMVVRRNIETNLIAQCCIIILFNILRLFEKEEYFYDNSNLITISFLTGKDTSILILCKVWIK